LCTQITTKKSRFWKADEQFRICIMTNSVCHLATQVMSAEIVVLSSTNRKLKRGHNFLIEFKK
jgi:hypothetical protein